MNERQAMARYPLLLGDIGGTNARLAMLEGPGQRPVEVAVLRCADFPGPAAAIEHYLGGLGGVRPRLAGLAVATPVSGDEVRLTNSDWSFSVAALRTRLDLDELRVVNDFTAQALALPHLGAEDLRRVGGGVAVPGRPIAVLGPGTGLGVSAMIPCADGWEPLSGEGGHVSYAPADRREAEILRLLWDEFPHVSAERLISGMGLVNLYRAISRLHGVAAEPLEAPSISERGLRGECALCREALDTLCAMLGTVASNLVLTLGATGGVYIAGGIVPRLGEFFDHSGFRTRFEDKGRFSAYLAAVPSYVITAAYPGLVGLAGMFAASNATQS